MEILKHEKTSLNSKWQRAEIMMLKGFGNYTWVYTTDGQKVLLAKTMHLIMNDKSFCNLLRVHKSYCVNPNYIQKFEKGIEPKLIMNNGFTVDVSRRKKKELLNIVL